MKQASEVGITAKADPKAGTITIVLPLQKPKLSATGKTLIIAGTSGAVETMVQVNGKQVILNVNAYIYAREKGAPATPEASATETAA